MNEFIIGQMGEIELLERMFQLFDSHSGVPLSRGALDGGHSLGHQEFLSIHADGNCTTTNGERYMADRTLMELPLGVSELSLEWVAETNDKLFTDLTPQDRCLLYLHFYEEQSWKRIYVVLAGMILSPPPISYHFSLDRRFPIAIEI